MFFKTIRKIKTFLPEGSGKTLDWLDTALDSWGNELLEAEDGETGKTDETKMFEEEGDGLLPPSPPLERDWAFIWVNKSELKTKIAHNNTSKLILIDWKKLVN